MGGIWEMGLVKIDGMKRIERKMEVKMKETMNSLIPISGNWKGVAELMREKQRE